MTTPKRPFSHNGKARVFLLDDHALVREGLKRLIDEETDLTVCGQAEDDQEALKLITTSKPNIVIADLALQGRNAIDFIKTLKVLCPKSPVLVVSMYEESLYTERALRAGAKGYIMKKESAEKVVQAIRRVLEGKIYLSDAMAEKLLSKFTEHRDSAGESPLESLSDRELEVFQLIGQGYKASQIAEQLSLSVKTVETYRENIKLKLNLENAAQLAQCAILWVHSGSLS